MVHPAWKAASLVVFPLAAFLGVGTLIKGASHRELATTALRNAHAARCPTSAAPLNMRLLGYTGPEFADYWRVLGNPVFADTLPPGTPCPAASAPTARTPAWAAEERFIWLDLGFPLVYGGALIASLLVAWRVAGRPLRRAWVLAPPVALMVADWIENSAQLQQLSRWSPGTVGAVQGPWVAIASAATTGKWIATGVTVALLLWLAWPRRIAVPAQNLVPAVE